MKLIPVFVTALLLNSAMVSANSSCRSIQGHWVDHANSETEKLKASIEALKSMQNSSCKTFIDQMSAVTQKLSGLGLSAGDKKILDTPKQMRESLEIAAMSQDDKVTQNLVKQTLSSQTGVNQNLTNDPRNSLFQRARSYITDNSKSMANLVGTIDTKETAKCLDNASSAGQAVKAFGSIASILSAFTGAGVGEISSVVNAATVLVKSLSDKNIQKAMNSLEATQMLSTLSCVVETTVANYCEVQDAFELYQEMGKNSSKIAQLNAKYKKISSDQTNPLDSYFILHRDLPNIVSWIIKTKMVNVPSNPGEATTQIEYSNIITNFYNRIRSVYGIYQSKKSEIYSESCNELCKKRLIAVLVEQISGTLLGRVEEINGLRVNFFAEQYDPSSLAFAVLGKPTPPAVSGALNGGTWTDPLTQITYSETSVVDVGTFLKTKGRDGAPHPYLNDPIAVINSIGDNLERVFDGAIARATNFELEKLVGDKTNLVTRLISSPQTSVHGSFRNIRNYLTNFKKTIEEKLIASGKADLVKKLNNADVDQLDLGNNESQVVVNKEKNKLTKVQFDLSVALRDINELLSKVVPILEVLNRYGVKDANANDVLFTIFNKLLISVNGANYLPNRIETLAQVELRMALREDNTFIKDNFKDWFLVSDQTLHSFISPMVVDTRESGAMRESQLNTALSIANANLTALDLTYKDWLFAYIVALRAIDVSNESYVNPMSANYSLETQALKGFTSALLDYNVAVENKVESTKIAKLKKIKDEKMKKWINMASSKIATTLNPSLSIPFHAWEKISYWSNELFYNSKTIRLKDLKEHVKTGSFQKWADRLCLQSLAFIDSAEERFRFDLYCAKAELTNNDVAELERQGIIKPEVIKAKKLKVKYANLSRSTDAKERICSFRDYFRSNDALNRLITTIEQDDSDLLDE